MSSSYNENWRMMPNLTYSSKLRIMNDINNVMKEALPGIHIFSDDNDITCFHTLIEGPEDTPYAGGFFYFILRFPNDYPMSPPSVKLMTTAYETVRFNPNIDERGQVCLSILGRWPGPSWSRYHNIYSVLISVQALMSSEPFYNDPCHSKSTESEITSKAYNKQIEYDTLRVAVVGSITNRYGDVTHLPKNLRKKINVMFMQHYDEYITKINSKIDGSSKDTLQYTALKSEFEKLKAKFDGKY